MEEGTTTTPFDMVVVNQISRYHLAIEALHRVKRFRDRAAELTEEFEEKLTEHHLYVRQHLQDVPEIRDWTWTD
jgi:xylulose-5-phosphate/fructose-6-phosphate phosphoketolase